MDTTKYYPLSRGQKGLLVHSALVPDSAMLHLTARIDFFDEIDEDRMLKAIRLVGERLPCCRVRLHDLDEDTTVQYISDAEPDPVEVVDLTDKTPEEVEGVIRSWRDELFPNNHRDVQLYKFKLLRLADRKHTIYFYVHHFIMDGYALMAMIRYLDQVYHALSTGTELPPEGIEPWKMLEDEDAYYNSARYQKDRAWWEKKMESEPCFTSINGLGSPEFVEGKRYGRSINFEQLSAEALYRKIPSELIRKVNEDAAKNGVYAQSYYMLALRSYLGHVSGTDDVTIGTLAANRTTLVQKRSGLSTANILSSRSIIPETCSFRDAITELTATQNEYYRRSRVKEMSAFINGLHDVPLGNVYFTTWLTFQPYFDIASTNLRFRARFLSTGLTPLSLYLLILPDDASGGATYIYSVNYVPVENIERFHAFMLAFVDTGIDHPDWSIEKLIENCL